MQSRQSPRPACLFSAPGALAAAQGEKPDPAQGRRAAGGLPGIGEPGGVVSALGHVHRRVVVRRERDRARAAEREDSQLKLLDGVLRARALREYIVPEVVDTYLSADNDALKSWCSEAVRTFQPMKRVKAMALI